MLRFTDFRNLKESDFFDIEDSYLENLLSLLKSSVTQF